MLERLFGKKVDDEKNNAPEISEAERALRAAAKLDPAKPISVKEWGKNLPDSMGKKGELKRDLWIAALTGDRAGLRTHENDAAAMWQSIPISFDREDPSVSQSSEEEGDWNEVKGSDEQLDITPEFIAAENGDIELLKLIKEKSQFTPDVWRHRMNTPLISHKKQSLGDVQIEGDGMSASALRGRLGKSHEVLDQPIKGNKTPAKVLKKYLDKIYEALDHADNEPARQHVLAVCEMLLDINPGDRDVRFKRAVVMGKVARSERNSGVLLEIADEFRALDKGQEAANAYIDAFRINPPVKQNNEQDDLNRERYLYCGSVFCKLEKFGRADAAYRAALVFVDKNQIARRAYANFLLEAGMREQRIDRLQAAAESFSSRLKDFTKALEVYDYLIRLKEDYQRNDVPLDVYSQRAVVLHELAAQARHAARQNNNLAAGEEKNDASEVATAAYQAALAGYKLAEIKMGKSAFLCFQEATLHASFSKFEVAMERYQQASLLDENQSLAQQISAGVRSVTTQMAEALPPALPIKSSTPPKSPGKPGHFGTPVRAERKRDMAARKVKGWLGIGSTTPPAKPAAAAAAKPRGKSYDSF